MKTLEVNIPEHWTPELALAAAELVRRAVRDGFPIIASIRETATPEQIHDVYSRIRDMLEEAGLAA